MRCVARVANSFLIFWLMWAAFWFSSAKDQWVRIGKGARTATQDSMHSAETVLKGRYGKEERFVSIPSHFGRQSMSQQC